VLGEDGNVDRSSVGRRRWASSAIAVVTSRRLRYRGDGVGQHLLLVSTAGAGVRHVAVTGRWLAGVEGGATGADGVETGASVAPRRAADGVARDSAVC